MVIWTYQNTIIINIPESLKVIWPKEMIVTYSNTFTLYGIYSWKIHGWWFCPALRAMTGAGALTPRKSGSALLGRSWRTQRGMLETWYVFQLKAWLLSTTTTSQRSSRNGLNFWSFLHWAMGFIRTVDWINLESHCTSMVHIPSDSLYFIITY